MRRSIGRAVLWGVVILLASLRGAIGPAMILTAAAIYRHVLWGV